MDPPTGFGILRRKRHEEEPFVTFSIPDRKLTFDRLFEADSLEEFKVSVQSRAKLGPEVRYDLIHTRDGDEVSIEDDQDFKAFAASTRYYHHSRGGPPAKKRRIQAPKASTELSTTPAAPVPTTDAAPPPAQEKPKPRRKPASKAAQVPKPPAADPPASAPAAPGAPAEDAPAPAPPPAPKRSRKKAEVTTAKDSEPQPQADGEPTSVTGKSPAEDVEAVKVGPPAKKPRKSTSKKAAPEATANPPPPAAETQPAAPAGTSSGGKTKKAAPKTPATLPSPTPSPPPEDEDPAFDTSNRKEPEKGPKKMPAPATARARSASSASNTSSVHPEDEAIAHEVPPSKTKVAAKPKSTAAKKTEDAGSKPKSRAKAPAKPAAVVEGDAVPDAQPTEDPPKKKRTAKPKSAAAGTDAAAPKDAADAPAKPKATRAPKSKAAAPSEEQAPHSESDHAETSTKADQGAAKKRKKDATHPEEEEPAPATAKASTSAPPAKKPRRSTKPPTAPCRICLSHAQHNWFDCPTILACITPPQNADDKKALDAALTQVEKRLKELEEEQASDPKLETADLITSIKTSITMAKANQQGQPLVDEEEAPKKKRRTTSAKKKDGGDEAAAGEKEKGDGKKASEVLPTFASTRVKETGPNAVPPSLSPTATAADLPVNPPAGSTSANDDSRGGQTEEVGGTEGPAGLGGEGKAKKGGTTGKTKKAAAQLPAKEATERAKAPRVSPLPPAHVADETLMNSFTPVDSVNSTLAPEPRWTASPEPASRPSKLGNVPTVANKKGGAKQKDTRTVQTTADTTQPNDHPASNLIVGSSSARAAKSSEVSSTPKKLSYIDAFSSSEEEEEEDSDGDVEMKKTNPSSPSKMKSKPHTFLSPSPPPDLTPSRLKPTSKLASAPSVIRPRQETESESEEAPKNDTRRTRTDGPPTIASSAKKPIPGAKLGAERLVSSLPRPSAKGNVRSEGKSSSVYVLVPGTPDQNGSSSDESSEEEEEEVAAQPPKNRGQDAAAKKGNLNATPVSQSTPKPVLPPNSSIARLSKLSTQDATPKPQDRRAASPVKSVQNAKHAESSDSESSISSDSEDEKAVSEAVKPSRKGSTTSDSSTSSEDAPTMDARRKPVAARPLASHSVSHTPAQKSFPSLQSLSSQPRRPVHRPPNFLSQPRRPDSSQAQQTSDRNDSDDSDDESSGDDDVPKNRRAGAGVQSKKKAGRLQAWS